MNTAGYGKASCIYCLIKVVNFDKENSDIALLGNMPNEFISHVSSAIKDDNQHLANRRIACPEENSWSLRVKKTSDTGGVGESGEIGQGYQERVAYVVELYRLVFQRIRSS